MSDTKYAPGPWAVEASPRPGSESWYVQDAIGNDVCRVRGGEIYTGASARLIAAAPELLALVQTAIDVHQRDQWLKDARAVLEGIEG